MRLRHRLYSRKDTVKGHDHQWFHMAISTLSRAGRKKIRHASIILSATGNCAWIWPYRWHRTLAQAPPERADQRCPSMVTR